MAAELVRHVPRMLPAGLHVQRFDPQRAQPAAAGPPPPSPPPPIVPPSSPPPPPPLCMLTPYPFENNADCPAEPRAGSRRTPLPTTTSWTAATSARVYLRTRRSPVRRSTRLRRPKRCATAWSTATPSGGATTTTRAFTAAAATFRCKSLSGTPTSTCTSPASARTAIPTWGQFRWTIHAAAAPWKPGRQRRRTPSNAATRNPRASASTTSMPTAEPTDGAIT